MLPDDLSVPWLIIGAFVWAAALTAVLWIGAWRWRSRALRPLVVAFVVACVLVEIGIWIDVAPQIRDYLKDIVDTLDPHLQFTYIGVFVGYFVPHSAMALERAAYALLALMLSAAIFWHRLARRPALLVPMSFAVELGLVAILAPSFWPRDETFVAPFVAVPYGIGAPLHLAAALVTGRFAYRMRAARWPLLSVAGLLIVPVAVRMIPAAADTALLFSGLGATNYLSLALWAGGIAVALWGGLAVILVWLRFPTRYLVRRQANRPLRFSRS